LDDATGVRGGVGAGARTEEEEEGVSLFFLSIRAPAWARIETVATETSNATDETCM